MAVIPGNSWVKFYAINSKLNRTLELTSEEVRREIFRDFVIREIPPFCFAYGVETVLVDKGLISLANNYFEAGGHENQVHVGGKT